MFRLSKLLEKLEDKSEARFKSWLARNKAKLPMRVPAVIVGWYFYGMFLNSLRLGIASTFHTGEDEIKSIWVLNPFKNWGAVFTGFGIVTTLVIVLIICLITKKGYIWFSGYKYTHDPRGFDILPDGTHAQRDSHLRTILRQTAQADQRRAGAEQGKLYRARSVGVQSVHGVALDARCGGHGVLVMLRADFAAAGGAGELPPAAV